MTNHRAICYDDEGSLECCCALRTGLDQQHTELISRAEAHALVADYQVTATAAVLAAATTSFVKFRMRNASFFRDDHNELSRETAGYAADAEAERNRGS